MIAAIVLFFLQSNLTEVQLTVLHSPVRIDTVAKFTYCGITSTRSGNKPCGYRIRYGLDSLNLTDEVVLGDSSSECCKPWDDKIIPKVLLLTLERGWKYWASVRAFNSAGMSPPFRTSFTVPLQAEPEPVRFAMANRSMSIIELERTVFPDTAVFTMQDSMLMHLWRDSLAAAQDGFEIDAVDSIFFRYKRTDASGYEHIAITPDTDELIASWLEPNVYYVIGATFWKDGIRPKYRDRIFMVTGQQRRLLIFRLRKL